MKTLSLKALFSNLILAFLFAVPLSAYANINPVITAFAITSVSTGIQYFSPGLFSGKLMEGLQTEVWIPGIKENPLPDMSFINQSVDMSEFVENNTLHLAEAGVDPDVHEDYFRTNSDFPVTFYWRIFLHTDKARFEVELFHFKAVYTYFTKHQSCF